MLIPTLLQVGDNNFDHAHFHNFGVLCTCVLVYTILFAKEVTYLETILSSTELS